MNEIALDLTQLPQNEGDVVRVQESGQDIALFRVNGELRAIDNTCPHYGAALSDGWVEDGVVACPWHCWQFDTATGECLSVAGFNVQKYPVEVREGQAFLSVETDSTESPDV